MLTVQLAAHRCPDAQLKARAAIAMLRNSEQEMLLIESVETRLLRDLPMYLADIRGVEMVGFQYAVITDAEREQWSEEFDDDEHSHICDKLQILLRKCGVSSVTEPMMLDGARVEARNNHEED